MASKILFRITIHSLLTIFILLGQFSIADDNYDYPIKNPIAATVIGTPSEYKADLGKFPGYKTLKLKVYNDRVTPKYFWYNDKISYGLLAQKQQSPLIFIVAGTGGNYTGPKIKTLSQAYFNAGFHVVTLPSPTYMSFIIAASNSSVPGLLDDDSHDLYNVMKLAWNTQLKQQIKVSDFYITGYSLGGAQAAYITYIDEQQKHFNFKKTLILNTPVSLLSSANILDEYVNKSFPPDQGGKKFYEFWKNTWALIAERYANTPRDELTLSSDFLFELYKDSELDNKELEALIAIAFRISAASMMVTSDVMSKSGFIVPKGTTAKVNADVTDYFVVAHRTGFNEYAKDLMLPYNLKRDPDLTFEHLVERSSLYPIEDYLRNSEKIGLMHNEDDIIMAPGEIEWLKDVFGDRGKFYPHGGHLGNVAHKDNITYMINFFKH
jgi:hypothetical protein